METILGENFGTIETLPETLCDGQTLCRLINKIQPQTIGYIHSSKSEVFNLENVNSFYNACQKFGISNSDMIDKDELLHEKNIVRTIRCLFVLVEKLMNNSTYASIPRVKPAINHPLTRPELLQFCEEQLEQVTKSARKSSAGSNILKWRKTSLENSQIESKLRGKRLTASQSVSHITVPKKYLP